MRRRVEDQTRNVGKLLGRESKAGQPHSDDDELHPRYRIVRFAQSRRSKGTVAVYNDKLLCGKPKTLIADIGAPMWA